MSARYASEWPLPWERFSSPAEQKANGMHSKQRNHDPSAARRRQRTGDRHGDFSEADHQTEGKIERFFHERTGQPIEKLKADMERDYFMDADEAKAYGVIDAVL